MDSNIYKGKKINIVAIGMHKDEALFIINDEEYITIHKRFIILIIKMIRTPLEKNELKFQFFHVLDGVQERNCFIQYKDNRYIVTIDNNISDISETLLESFVLAGFLKRFISIEEKKNIKPSFFEKYGKDQQVITIDKDKEPIVEENDIENNEENNIELDNDSDISMVDINYTEDYQQLDGLDDLQDIQQISKPESKIKFFSIKNKRKDA